MPPHDSTGSGFSTTSFSITPSASVTMQVLIPYERQANTIKITARLANKMKKFRNLFLGVGGDAVAPTTFALRYDMSGHVAGTIYLMHPPTFGWDGFITRGTTY